jgi:hypothetical protein
MQAGDPDVIHAIDRVSHQFGGHDCLFGDREIRRSRGRHDYRPPTCRDVAGPERNGPGQFLKLGVGQRCNNGIESRPIRARDEQAMATRDDSLSDSGNLLRGLSWAKDDLGESLTQASMVIDTREPEVFERRLAQELKEAVVRCLRRNRA